MEQFSETTADTRQRELVHSLGRIARGEADESDSERINSYIQEEIFREFQREFERFHVQNMVVDDFCGFTFKNGEWILFHDLEEDSEPEQDLEAGDASALDTFLGGFLAPGA